MLSTTHSLLAFVIILKAFGHHDSSCPPIYQATEVQREFYSHIPRVHRDDDLASVLQSNLTSRSTGTKTSQDALNHTSKAFTFRSWNVTRASLLSGKASGHTSSTSPTNGDSLRVDVPTITASPPRTMPTWPNGTSTLPSGYGVFQNTTFKTSCVFTDRDCYAACTESANSCSTLWQYFTRGNPSIGESLLTVGTGVTTSTLRGFYTFSPSIYGDATYEYAMVGTGAPPVSTSLTYWNYPFGGNAPTCTFSEKVSCMKGPDSQLCTMSGPGYQRCTVRGGTVRLLYWPSASTPTVHATGGPTGARNGTGTITDQRTSLATPLGTPTQIAILGNRTLTSPSVYISFETAYATNECGQTLGQAFPSALLPLDPSSLYSVNGEFDYGVETSDGHLSTFFPSAPFNFGDLTGLVPVSVYIAQPSCVGVACYTIFPDYAPVLVLPPQLRELDPAWKSCALDFEGAWDPPVALTPQAVVATVTMPGVVVTTSAAAPQSGVGAPAQQTQGIGIPSSSAVVTESGAEPNPVSQPTVSAAALPSDNSAAALSLALALPGMLQSVGEANPVASTDASTPLSAAIISPLSTAALSNVGPAASTDDPTSESGLEPLASLPSPTDAYQVFSQARQSAASLVASPADPHASADAASSQYTSSVTTSDDPGSIDPPSTSVDEMTSTNPTATAAEAETVPLGTPVYSTGPNSAPSSDPQDPATIVSPPSGLSASAEAVFTLASETLTAIPIAPTNGNGQAGLAISVASQTIAVNSDPAIFSGHIISAATNGVVVDGTLLPFSTPTPLSNPPASEATLALALGGTSAIIASLLSQSEVLIGTQTLLPGSSAVVIAGHTFTAVSSGIVEDGSTTVVFPSPPAQGPGEPVDPELTTTARATSTGTSTDLWPIISSRSLTPNGPALILSGHTFTAVSDGNILEDGTLLGYTNNPTTLSPDLSSPTDADPNEASTTTTAESTAFFLPVIAFGRPTTTIPTGSSDSIAMPSTAEIPSMTAKSQPSGAAKSSPTSSTSASAAVAVGRQSGSFLVAMGWWLLDEAGWMS
ncbi:hypothetical protein LTR91_015771 [Friedmanniomyces endolithicus]|uniref:Uncharacterized protein n=1 Tax=Friedmanniomyces endolithicus TaxID=329885 RepID=A0AAN6QLL4_9PEZI|nr:hypothetical protein LTR75_009214 [Friedmanniomyces endolithicus]KAK0876397.1 hypothetical protein LTR87_009793 [Friedmanniomyces endolithicus]KAK0887708.1 hypothetical protein LTR02_016979 [Friedmanniomyces endolithicus]KAK0929458.1 hypothetical protein LTR57_001938 [Friedmanniomyces endolithicus]KAK0953394.1 hypothetical protein LTS01_024405 [Friedmanniomyces endolithicus]